MTGGAYGPIFELWLDGANGGDGYYGGAWEKRSIITGYYRFEDVIEFVRGLNPELTIFGFGGEFCWPGNERGIVDPESGCTRGTRFRPWEADFPLRPGWFYHQSQDGFSRSGEFLMKAWLRTVGNAATMNIGISPDCRGLLTEEDVGALRRFAELKETFFANEVSASEPKHPPAPFDLRGVLSVKRPDSLTFTVKRPQTICALMLTPDQDQLGGTPVVFRLSTSRDGEKWVEDQTEFRLDNVAANPIVQRVDLPRKTQVKYVRLTAVRTLTEDAEVSLAGLELVPQ